MQSSDYEGYHMAGSEEDEWESSEEEQVTELVDKLRM